MKKTIFLFCSLMGYVHAGIEFKADERVRALVTQDQQITPVVKELFSLTEITCDGSLADAKRVALEVFRRPNNPKSNLRKEPWTKPASPFDANFEQALPLFERMNFFEEVLPESKEYTYAIVLGGCMRWMRQRLASLVKAWNSGVRFSQIVVLTGDRPRDVEYENDFELNNRDNGIMPIKAGWCLPNVLPNNETGLVQLLFDQADLPVEFAQLPLTIVNAPKRYLPDGKLVRPNTRTTIEHWLEQDPRPTVGSCLVASSQPYVTYQDVVMRCCMPAEFSIETIGSAIHPDDKTMSTLTDVLAVTLMYQHARMS
jgi:hypothetical protein